MDDPPRHTDQTRKQRIEYAETMTRFKMYIGLVLIATTVLFTLAYAIFLTPEMSWNILFAVMIATSVMMFMLFFMQHRLMRRALERISDDE
jgi:Mg2+/Co2+ transporter CorB